MFEVKGLAVGANIGTDELTLDRRVSRWQLVIPFLIYCALSILLFGRALLGHFSAVHIGSGGDPPSMMWSLAWWPHAIANGLNPFVTGTIWAPYGLNLTWSTRIPLISLLGAPLIAAFGPVASLNIACLLGPPLAAWCGFLVCLDLSEDYWASILGGYIFGFCPFMFGALSFARLHLISAFPVPLAIYLAIRRFREKITVYRFALLFALVLVAEFLCSVEIFATMTIFGGMALVLAWLLNPGEVRHRLSNLLLIVAGSYVAAFIVVSPYLFYFFFEERPFDGPIWNSQVLSADALNLLIPSPLNEIGCLPLFESISRTFNHGRSAETVAYLSWPLLIIAAVYARRHWHEPLGKLLVDFAVVLLVFSFGGVLMVKGNLSGIGLPWQILDETSVLKNAAPVRLLLYVYLILAVITSLWLSAANLRPWLKLTIAAAIIALQLPNLSAAFWVHSVVEPAFFRDGLYRNYLKKDDTVLILPFWPRGDSMLWQAETRMYFRMAGGDGPWPKQFRRWPIIDAFAWRSWVPDAPAQFDSYLTDNGVSALIVEDSNLPLWGKLASSLPTAPIRVGGVSIYRLPKQSVTSSRLTLIGMRKRFDNQRYETLLVAIQKYLSNGGNERDLVAAKAPDLGLIPANAIIGPPVDLFPEDNRYGIQLHTGGDDIIVGEFASQPAAEELIEKYRSCSSSAQFTGIWLGRTRAETVGQVSMSFDRQQLARAAAIAQAAPKPASRRLRR